MQTDFSRKCSRSRPSMVAHGRDLPFDDYLLKLELKARAEALRKRFP